MLQEFLTDFNTAKLQSSLIPKGTIVKVKMAVKPGGYECWFTRSLSTGSIYLNAEFTVIESSYAKQKIYQIIGIKSGKAEGTEDSWGESGRSMIRSILESARNILPDDTSEKAVLARKINSIADLNGLEFMAKIGIESDSRYGNRNRIAAVITPEQQKNSESDWVPFWSTMKRNCGLLLLNRLYGKQQERIKSLKKQLIHGSTAQNLSELFASSLT